jgi:hypothetical protein
MKNKKMMLLCCLFTVVGFVAQKDLYAVSELSFEAERSLYLWADGVMMKAKKEVLTQEIAEKTEKMRRAVNKAWRDYNLCMGIGMAINVSDCDKQVYDHMNLAGKLNRTVIEGQNELDSLNAAIQKNDRELQQIIKKIAEDRPIVLGR